MCNSLVLRWLCLSPPQKQERNWSWNSRMLRCSLFNALTTYLRTTFCMILLRTGDIMLKAMVASIPLLLTPRGKIGLPTQHLQNAANPRSSQELKRYENEMFLLSHIFLKMTFPQIPETRSYHVEVREIRQRTTRGIQKQSGQGATAQKTN